MSVSNLFDKNNFDLNAKSLKVDDNLTSTGLVVNAVMDGESVSSNPHLSFSNEGSAYITSGDTLRFGKNAASAGLVMNFTNDGDNCDLIVKGDITADNLPSLRGSSTWSGAGSSLTVSAPGVASGDHVFVTVHTPASEPAELSHVVAGSGQFTVHLTSSNSSNDLGFHWFVMKSPA